LGCAWGTSRSLAREKKFIQLFRGAPTPPAPRSGANRAGFSKSSVRAAVRYALNQRQALARFLDDGELEIDNRATERANRDIARQPRFDTVLVPEWGVLMRPGSQGQWQAKESKGFKWYARVDSNHRPFAPEANALSS
jgi:transposase IS66 family protein